ncbi:MAG: MBL fold metallo-hydrolase [Candidatus Margulisbacteria bacterium]|nr:MBL fold metallo-hydrolase [Candidatus Margulisiibacteriota bacterium]
MQIFTVKVGVIDTNCYILVDSKDNCWIIDPGNDSKKIIEVLEREKVSPSKILLTHGHFDHIEAVARLRQLFPEVTVYVHAEDIPFLTNNKIWEAYLGRPLIDAKYDKTINEGDFIQQGGLSAKVISTPGHSAGSVCYLIGNNLFSGDTLFAFGGIGRTDLWNSSASAMRSSLKKLLEIEENLTVYPGHGPSSTLDHEKTYRH